MTSNTQFLVLLYKFRKFIISIVLICTIVSLVISHFTEPKFKSTAIVYPTTKNSLNDVVNNPEFGYLIHAEKLIQVFQSQQLMDSVVKKFDLITHFHIDTNKQGWSRKLKKRISESLRFKRTKYLSVEITAITNNYQLSHDITQYCTGVINTIQEYIFKSNILLATNSYKLNVESQKAISDSLRTKIFNLHASNTGPNPLQKQIKNSIIERNKKGVYTPIDNHILNLSSTNTDPNLNILIDQYLIENGKYLEYKKKYDLSIDKLNQPLPRVYIISSATLDDQKISPSKTKYAIFGVFFGFLLSTTVILVRNKYLHIRSSLK